ncbi:MAG: TetR/AcrR family transcriptional regulator [Sporichthyaceae bacterium]
MTDAAPLDRECYFRAAYELLTEGGSAALTVAALCDRVGATKGSFYHHFAGMSEFVAAFAERWQAWVEHIFDDYLAEPNLMRRLELAANSHVVLLTGAEPAIWIWARSEPVIAAACEAVRKRGNDFGHATYDPLCGDAQVSTILFDLVTWAMHGLQGSMRAVDRNRFAHVIGMFLRRCLHLDVDVVVRDGRELVRVNGPLPEPIRPHRPVWLPEADADGRRPLFDAAMARAVAELTPTARRGREAFFRVAREILAEQPSDGLTVAALCERLSVTKGSFHHHFPTMADFVVAMTAHWEAKFGALIDHYDTEPDPLRRLELMFVTAFALPRPLESAWWAWGRSNPAVRPALERQERRAEQAMFQIFVELGEDPETARSLAEFGLGLALGLQFHFPPVSSADYVVAFVEWARRCLHLDADLGVLDGLPHLAVHRSA